MLYLLHNHTVLCWVQEITIAEMPFLVFLTADFKMLFNYGGSLVIAKENAKKQSYFNLCNQPTSTHILPQDPFIHAFWITVHSKQYWTEALIIFDCFIQTKKDIFHTVSTYI